MVKFLLNVTQKTTEILAPQLSEVLLEDFKNMNTYNSDETEEEEHQLDKPKAEELEKPVEPLLDFFQIEITKNFPDRKTRTETSSKESIPDRGWKVRGRKTNFLYCIKRCISFLNSSAFFLTSTGNG